jgi:hypothetical protein
MDMLVVTVMATRNYIKHGGFGFGVRGTSTEKAKRYLAERRFIHALIPDTDIILRYANSRE